MIYFFRKQNGEIVQASYTQAYDYIYENKNMLGLLTYIGRSNGNNIIRGLPEIRKKTKEYKESLMTPGIKELISFSQESGTITPEEEELAIKVRNFENEMYDKLVEEELKTVEKIYPEKNSNIITPQQGLRDKIISSI